jgi:NAD(P)-dependent dehydrogenase (short-subunit alcohol dehydrogenase family)
LFIYLPRGQAFPEPKVVEAGGVGELRLLRRGLEGVSGGSHPKRWPGPSTLYFGTKFAVHAKSEAIRRELHGERIRVMVVSPGWVNTELS